MKKLTNPRCPKLISKNIVFFHFGIIALLIILFYKVTLSGYFIADDFWEIKYFSEGSLLRKVVSNFASGEWEALPFYRPIAVLLHAIAFSLFHTDPFGYHLINLCLHIANSTLVCCLVNFLTRNRNKNIGFSAGILFAVYPLHPNTVCWIAAFATGYGTLFILLSFISYLIFRRSNARKHYLLSLLFFFLALGSYETAVALPLFILLYESTMNHENNQSSLARHFFLRSLFPFLVLLLGYFLLRKLAIGEFIGGYSNYISALSTGNLFSLLGNFVFNLKAINPVYSGMEGFEFSIIVNLTFLILFSFFFILIFIRNRKAFGHLFFSLGWVIASWATFLFQKFDPANSRISYLYSVGLCMGITFLIFDGVAVFKKKFGNWMVMGFACLLISYYSFLLFQHIDKYRESADSTLVIQKQLVNVYKSHNSSGTIFLLDYPAYVFDKNMKVHLAPKYQIGISDALGKPFINSTVGLYPLPKVSLSELRPLFLGTDDSIFCVWDERSRMIKRLPGDNLPGETLPEIQILLPDDKSVLYKDDFDEGILFKPGSYRNFRLIILTDVIPLKHKIRAYEQNSDAIHVNLLLEPDLYPFRFYSRNKVYWWISAMDDDGVVIAQSKLRSFEVKRR